MYYKVFKTKTNIRGLRQKKIPKYNKTKAQKGDNLYKHTYIKHICKKVSMDKKSLIFHGAFFIVK